MVRDVDKILEQRGHFCLRPKFASGSGAVPSFSASRTRLSANVITNIIIVFADSQSPRPTLTSPTHDPRVIEGDPFLLFFLICARSWASAANMLPSSIRRVAAAPSPISLAGAALPRAAAAAATAALSRRGPHSHQRRYSSSSKPSSPDNGSGSKDLPSSQSVPSSSTSRSGGERRKRKAKDAAGRDSATKLPSVPSTQYLSQEGALMAGNRVISMYNLLTTVFSPRPLDLLLAAPADICHAQLPQVHNRRRLRRDIQGAVPGWQGVQRHLHPVQDRRAARAAHGQDDHLQEEQRR